MARKGFALVVAAALVAMSACSQRAEADSQRFDDHARAVAAAWSTADQQELWRTSLVPLGPLTVEPDWSGHESLMDGVRSGSLDWVSEKVGDTAESGTVRYADGSTEAVTTLGARATLSELFTGGTTPCASTCTAAVVTGADPTTTTLLTARGQAVVPAWAFHLDGLPQPVVRVAVAGLRTLADVEPHVPDSTEADGLLPVTALVADSGRTITVRLPVSDCTPTPGPEALETPTVVVVGAVEPTARGERACAAVLRDRDVPLTLSRPLGHRVLVTVRGRLVPPLAPSSS